MNISIEYCMQWKYEPKAFSLKESIQRQFGIEAKLIEGSAYWESPTLSIPTTKENERALKEHLEGKKKQRKGV